jgi:hypothetical protein
LDASFIDKLFSERGHGQFANLFHTHFFFLDKSVFNLNLQARGLVCISFRHSHVICFQIQQRLLVLFELLLYRGGSWKFLEALIFEKLDPAFEQLDLLDMVAHKHINRAEL